MIRALDLQSKPLSIADLAGRAGRWVRPNLKLIFLVLFVPELIYHLSWEAFSWLLEKQGMGAFLSWPGVALVASLLVLILSLYEIAARCVAIWFLIIAKEVEFSKALSRARKARLLLVFFPTIVNELLVALPFGFLLLIANEIDKLGHKAHGLGLDLVILNGFLFLLLWTVPFKAIFMANMAAAFTILAREESIASGLKKVIYFCRRAPHTVLYAILAFALIASIIEVPSMLAIVAENIIKATITFDKELIEWAAAIVRILISAGMVLISLGFEIAAAALLDNELRIRLDGCDIIEGINRLANKPA